MSKSKSKKKESDGQSSTSSSRLQSKSPAEFFAEHQNIAGFDNAGKSLYTTIRELIENSLDACESVNALPDIVVEVERLSTHHFQQLRGISEEIRSDLELYQTKSKKRKAHEMNDTTTADGADGVVDGDNNRASSSSSKTTHFYRVRVRDNGSGIPHDSIPVLFGTVLTSTKYTLKQTRGKFGLGAKMALVWSKKSTGLPIVIESSQSSDSRQRSYCQLDIDIYKNTPHVLRHERIDNTQTPLRGTIISLVIGGNWPPYQAKVVHYIRQLAIITPYANLTLQYEDDHDKHKSFTLQCRRRTEVMPPVPTACKHHPSQVDNLLIESLIHSHSAPSSSSSSTSSSQTKEIYAQTFSDTRFPSY